MIKLQSGRSMVEMLGVLAVIGVLSVGAISGYGKAMMRYKLNKQSTQLTHLLNILYQYKDEWDFSGSKDIDLIPFYESLKEIPYEMIKKPTDVNSNGRIIYDVFNSEVQMRTNGTWSMGSEVLLTYQIENNHAYEICLNATNIGLAFREHLLYLGVMKTTSNSSSNQFDTKYFGDYYCNDARETNMGKCLSDLDMDAIYKQCKFCEDSKTCIFRYQFVSN